MIAVDSRYVSVCMVYVFKRFSGSLYDYMIVNDKDEEIEI